jgi:hypothetical protein
VSLVKQLDLVQTWKQSRAPAQRAKDWIFALLGRQPTDEEQARGLVGLLETRLYVAPGDGTVSIGVQWPDPVMGARIVDTAQQNFLEQRHVMEISTIAESVSILEEHAAKLRKEIDELMDQGRSPAAGAASAAPSSGEPAALPPPQRAGGAPSVASGRARRNPEAESELARKKVMIEAKQRAINDLEDFRQRRLLDLQASMAEQRSRYTDAHPIVLGLQQNIAAISKESPQVTALRAEVKTLQEEYDRASRAIETSSAGSGGGGRVPSGPASAALPINPAALQEPGRPTNPAMEAQLGYALSKYSEIRAQISTARIELDLAQAAFRYRYTVVVPAEPPAKPIKPKVALIVGASAIGALGLALIAAVLSEIRSGRLVNRWQVERLLKVPVLAELQVPKELGPHERP